MPNQQPHLFHQPGMVSARDFIGTLGQCFYIPAYQRDFSWADENFERFIEDIGTGMNRLLQEEDVVTFIGTMICFHDTKFKTIHPIVRPDVPARAYTVVDGQQRLTLLMLVAASLHDFLRVSGTRGNVSPWLKEQRDEYMQHLERIIEEKMPTGEFPHYPRMIRAFDDQWAKTSQSRMYRSPLSYFVSSYGAFFRDASNAGKNFKYQIPEGIGDENRRETHRKFLRIVNKIGAIVRRVCNGKTDNFPDIEKIFAKPSVLSALFNIEELPSGTFDANNERHAQIARAVALASYVLNKIWFVTLVTLDESYAFDIFEALNTTGQVLTAYETFQPEIIRAEGLEEFESSVSKMHTDSIGGYLNALDKQNQKIKTTSELLISFALAENGSTIPKDLRNQRKYLRESYGRLAESLPDQRDFTRHLMHTAEVMQIWNKEGSAKINELFHIDESLKWEAETARFCLDFLAEPNHHIVRALIIRFHEAARLADEGRSREHIADIFSVVKALAAFYAIWRGSRETTDGIDARHRKLVRDHYSRMMLTPAGGYVLRDANLSARDVKQALVTLLKENGGDSERKIVSQSDWIKHATKVPIYSTSRPITRFLLLVAAHNARPMNNGLLEPVRDGARALIAEGAWGKDDYLTIEHVIPQSNRSDLGCEKGELDRLGNLTLIPHKANSILSNRSWEQKQAIFRALSAETEPELREAIHAQHFPPEHRESEYLKTRYLPMTKAVSLCKNFTSPEHFEDRGKNLAELAWERLAVEWLGFNGKP